MSFPPLPGAPTPRPLAHFIALAYGLSWLTWAPLVLASQRGDRTWPYFHLIGGLGPAVAALALTALDGREPLRGLMLRLDPRRTAPKWLALAIFGPPGLYLLAAIVLRISGQPWPRLADFGASKEYAELGRTSYWAANIIFYGYGEEIGWRGYLLPRLQARRSPLSAALVVSLAWSLWHLPLFWFAAGMQAMGPAGVAGWFFSLVTGSILMTWLFNASGSLTAVALFHGILDIVIGSPGHPMTANIMGAALTLWGIALVLVTGRALSATRRSAPR